MFKNQLGEYAQKAGLRVPTYQVIKEGPPHDPKYKATVFVGDQIYESPTSFGNLKKAEHAAAEVALNALGTKLSLHESGLCKNLLQQYAQKCKLPLPVYTLAKFGEPHSPHFNATVEISGVTYTGGLCKTKKEAEIKAAKNALIAICSNPDTSPIAAPGEQTAFEEPTISTPPVMNTKVKTKRLKKARFTIRGDKRRKLQSNGIESSVQPVFQLSTSGAT